MTDTDEQPTLPRQGSLIDEAWRSRGVTEEDLILRNGTLFDDLMVADTVHGDDLLPNLLSPPMAEVIPGEPIGAGGLGQVDAARQRSLQRSVAIKRLRVDAPVGTDASPLLREARVTGALEHPNIVPIHLVGQDDEGRPIIVMKRIEGQSWAQLLAARSHPEDDLERHLRILLDVCRATRFAHERGVLHRDIKPGNVMVGGYDDVYLLDWGLAVALRPNGIDDLPLASTTRAIVGTPGYMAPEMVLGEGDELSVRTDVYLLGAVLHEIVCGEPPHQGASIRATLEDAMIDRGPYGPNVPWELAHLCRQSMAVLPHQRPPNVADFAASVEQYLAHRHAHALAERAAEQLAELDTLLAEAASAPRYRERLYRTFGACRFAFAHAIEVTADNVLALHGLAELVSKMVRFELDHGTTAAARTLLADLPAPDPKLATAVKRAEKAEAAERARLEEVAKAQDVTIGDAQRGAMAIGTGFVIPVAAVAIGALGRAGTIAVDHLVIGLAFAVFLVAVVGVALRARHIFFDTDANARTSWNYLIGFAGFTGLWPLAAQLELSVGRTFAVGSWIGAALLAVATLTSDRRLAPLAVCLLVSAIAGAAWPAWALEVFGALMGVGCFLVGLAWLHRARMPAPPT